MDRVVRAGRVIVVALLVAGVVAVAAAQETTDDATPVGGLTFVDEVEVTEADVIVHVTDRDGSPVHGLETADFRLLQDGIARDITAFGRSAPVPPETAPGSVPQGPASAADAADAALTSQPIHVVLYVDHEHLDPLDRNRAIAQATSFVRATVGPLVPTMVVSAHRTSYDIAQPFTTTSAEVQAALRELRVEAGGERNRATARDDLLHTMQRSATDPTGAASLDAGRAFGSVTAYAEEEAASLQFTLGSLRDVVNILAGLPGRKVIVYLSNGLPMVAGLELFYVYSSAYGDPSAVTLSSRYSQVGGYDSLAAAANAQDVSFYTLDAGGLRAATVGNTEGSGVQDIVAANLGEQNLLDPLRLLAERTGGLAVVTTNDLRAGLARIHDDLFSYYTLGYPLVTTGADRVHEVQVALPAHPELELRYRRRLVEKSRATRVQDRVLSGLLFPVADDPLGLTLTIGTAVAAGSDRFTLPITLAVPVASIALLPAGDLLVGEVTVFVAARDSAGKRSDLVRQEHHLEIPAAGYAAPSAPPFEIATRLLMEGGRATLSIGVMDAITRQASYAQSTVVIGK